MKTIKMKSNRATNKIYKKKCMAFEKIIKMWVQVNTSQSYQIAAMLASIKRIRAESKALLKKLAEHNTNIEPNQLYYRGRCETKFNSCKEKPKRKSKNKT